MNSARSASFRVISLLCVASLGACAGGDNKPISDAIVGTPDVTGTPDTAPAPDVTVDTGLALPDTQQPDLGRDGPVVVTPSDARADLAPDATVDGDSTIDSGALDTTAADTGPAPDSNTADGGCSGNAECDDNLTCTTDICGVGGCTNVITGSFCVIDGVCVAGGAPNPLNVCEACLPTQAADAWSNAGEAGCDDGDLCTHSDICVAGACVGTTYSCDDTLGCTTDACTGTGAAPDGCTHTLMPGFCTIEGACIVGGDADSSATCRICSPTAATDDWTLQAGFCLIDETCHLEGAANPLNPCETCKTADAIDAWTALPGTNPSPHSVVITEIMANPTAVGDTAGEWIELHNAGSTAVDLKNWTLRDDDSETHRISSSVVIAPGAYVVLARNGDSGTNGGVTVAYTYAGFQLANTNDEIVLIDDSCLVVDRVAYDSSSWPLPGGASLQLSDPALDNALPASWCPAAVTWSGSAGDDGTPGAAADCTPPPDGGTGPQDASVDTTLDATVDAGGDSTVDSTMDSGVDSGTVIPCGTSEVRVQEVAVGTPDYVVLKNYGTTAVDIVGYTMKMYGINPPTAMTYTIKASDVSGPLAAGASVYIVEHNSGHLPGDINTGANIPFFDGPPDGDKPNAGLLLDAAGNALDYAAIGENIGKPDNISFTAVPWEPTFKASVSSFQRTATNGSCPGFTPADWSIANLTR